MFGDGLESESAMTNGFKTNGRPYLHKLRYYWRDGGPVVTDVTIALCFAIWIVEVALRRFAPNGFVLMIGYGSFQPPLATRMPWTWLTSMFLHAPSVFHVLFNMMTLLVVGPYLERLMGHWNFLALYIACGLGGAAGMEVYCRLSGDWMLSAYGASGALFGLFAAVLVVFRRTGQDIRTMVVWMAINFAMPFFDHAVAWQAHVGGFVTGLALTWLLVNGFRPLRAWSLGKRMLVYGLAVAIILAGIIVWCVPVQSTLL
ncbi:peptidase, S54 rhomboid family [Bifidobacterium bombi DSM 19703]|uniref:Peptidase, S54 rhomboid family n=2 Tax=Bifidobacterium bombi TaxID=471511 RepID=A0A086BPK0_9BIFI|nr:peptidase, S54 rhomboid family [Bifidobacterium bombi DSM 19703]